MWSVASLGGCDTSIARHRIGTLRVLGVTHRWWGRMVEVLKRRRVLPMETVQKLFGHIRE